MGITRRLLLQRMLLPAPLTVAAAAAWAKNASRAWWQGRWQSDRERTMENFHFQGRGLTERERAQIGAIFGGLRYAITPTRFVTSGHGGGFDARYHVIGQTDSTVTLRFHKAADTPDLTMFRVSDDLLFIRSAGNNLEYFRRTAASPQSSR